MKVDKCKYHNGNSVTIFIILISAIGLLSCIGCGSKKNITEDLVEKVDENPKLHYDTNEPISGHIHPDSAKAVNERVLSEVKKQRIEPDSDTKYFTIDENTGEVNGCPLLKLTGQYNWQEDSIINAKEKEKFKKLLPKIEKVWLGTKEIIVSDEFPEGHDRYPDYGYFSANDEYVIVPDGDFHSGSIDRLYFFNSKGELLNNYKLDNTIEVPNMGYNREKTFFMLSSSVGPDFYIFYPDGKVFKKGNFHEFTGDKGTSYGKLNISKNGKFWVLKNNLAWVYDMSRNLQLKLPYNGNCILDEVDSTITYSNEGNLEIFNLFTKKLLYSSIKNDAQIINIISPSKVNSYLKKDKKNRKVYEKVN